MGKAVGSNPTGSIKNSRGVIEMDNEHEKVMEKGSEFLKEQRGLKKAADFLADKRKEKLAEQ